MAAWIGQFVHARRVYSHPARHCDCGADYQFDPRPTAIVARTNETSRDHRYRAHHRRCDRLCLGWTDWTTQKKDAQLGPLEITHKESHGIAFPPIAIGICLVGGIVLVIVGSRKR